MKSIISLLYNTFMGILNKYSYSTSIIFALFAAIRSALCEISSQRRQKQPVELIIITGIGKNSKVMATSNLFNVKLRFH